MNAQPSQLSTPPVTAAITLQNICKTYRRGSGGSRFCSGSNAPEIFPALKNISLEIAAGESVGIIGRNGCGKSTLLQILAGVMKPTSGRGEIQGEVAALLELGTGFHPDFSGRENISLNNAMQNLSRSAGRERLERIAAFADLGNFLDEPVRTYSTGMLLRLGFACAVAVDPAVFLVDEALAVGDIFFQQKCYDYMREQMGGKTRVIVSHDLQAITSFCSRVVVLEQGAIIFDGPPLQGVEFYLKALHAAQAPASPKPSTRIKSAAAAPQPSIPADDIVWRAVPPESSGGAGEVRITHFEVRVNESLFAAIVKPGDRVTARMKVDCPGPGALAEVLFGYLVRDKMGNAVFGENSASVAGGKVSLTAGRSQAELEFRWPEVQPGDYFLTLGVGEGTDPIRHRIQCWAHNAHLFSAISPEKPVHCLFNNPLSRFAFSLAEEPLAPATKERE